MNKKKNHANDLRPRYGLTAGLVLLLTVLVFLGIRRFAEAGSEKSKPTQQQQTVSQAAQVPATVLAIIYNSHHFPVSKTDSTDSTDSIAARVGKLLYDLQVENDPMKREELISDFLDHLSITDVQSALYFLKDATPNDLAGDVDRRLLRRWAEVNPQQVSDWLMHQPAGPQRQDALDNLAIAWANSQLTNAVSWGQSLADESERYQVLILVAGEAVRTDPLMALQLAVTFPADSQRDELIQRAAVEWTSQDPQDAIAWTKKISNVDLRTKMLAGEATALANQDPESAATLAVEELPPGKLLEDTVVSIVERWAQIQPQATAAWVRQFPAGTLRQTAMEYLKILWPVINSQGN